MEELKHRFIHVFSRRAKVEFAMEIQGAEIHISITWRGRKRGDYLPQYKWWKEECLTGVNDALGLEHEVQMDDDPILEKLKRLKQRRKKK